MKQTMLNLPYRCNISSSSYSGGNSVQEVGGKASRISDKFVLIVHTFFFFDKHGQARKWQK
jgi:hypothetical protein